MPHNRRTLLALGGGATLAASALGVQAAGQTSARRGQAAPKGLTYATLQTADGYGLGLRTAGGVLDVRAAERDLRLGLPQTVDDVIHGRGDLTALARLAEKPPARHLRPEASVRFGPCVTAPEKIVCVGLNYRAHVAEGGSQVPKRPVLFNKFNTSLNHHGGVIRITAEEASQWDYEAELVIVIGREARNVPEADALSYAFGYCTGQDFTARDLQRLNSQWMVGKCGDGWGPIGPWLVSADQVDPDNLDIRCLVNGQVRQSSNTKMMIFGCRQLISYISHRFTLKPGDIIFTGTPEGVIFGYPPEKQVWLKAGDRIVSSIERLGDQEVTLT